MMKWIKNEENKIYFASIENNEKNIRSKDKKLF